VESYSIGQAATMLGVSSGTLRNWDQSGYFRADRTAGKHRRYSAEKMIRFQQGERIDEKELVSSWECKLYQAQYQKTLEEGNSHPLARACGGFTRGEVGVLLRNKETCHDEKTRDLPNELLFEMLSAYAAPYLFTGRPLQNSTALIPYLRVRSNANGDTRLVMECEDICSRTRRHEESSRWWREDEDLEELKKAFLRLAEETDRELVFDALNNTGAVSYCKRRDIEKVRKDDHRSHRRKRLRRKSRSSF
jgi:DNA-binding transcriptional MerR regulator